MNERDLVCLRDLLGAAEHVARLIAGKTRSDLESSDEILGLAVVRLIQTVGESARQMSAEGQTQLTDVPWSSIIGMRHRVVHNYRDVDYDIVWQVAEKDLPEVANKVRTFLDDYPA